MFQVSFEQQTSFINVFFQHHGDKGTGVSKNGARPTLKAKVKGKKEHILERTGLRVISRFKLSRKFQVDVSLLKLNITV